MFDNEFKHLLFSLSQILIFELSPCILLSVLSSQTFDADSLSASFLFSRNSVNFARLIMYFVLLDPLRCTAYPNGQFSDCNHNLIVCGNSSSNFAVWSTVQVSSLFIFVRFLFFFDTLQDFFFDLVDTTRNVATSVSRYGKCYGGDDDYCDYHQSGPHLQAIAFSSVVVTSKQALTTIAVAFSISFQKRYNSHL